MAASPHLSFRDPDSRTLVLPDRVLRFFTAAGWEKAASTLAAAPIRRRVEAGDIVASREADVASAINALPNPVPGEEIAAVLEHDRIDFPSYPYEWPPEMLHAAATLTLSLSEELLEEDIGLKDATPYNILFRGSRPVFVDIASFERRDPHDPLWRAEGQFIRTFLLPLLADRTFEMPADRLLLARRDGLVPEELYKPAGPLRRLSPHFLALVTLPVWLGKRARNREAVLYRPRQTANAERARFILRRRLRSLSRRLTRLAPRANHSNWAGYMEELPYSAADFTAKESFVKQVLSRRAAKRVLDIGCNTGHFSALAAGLGARVVAIDSDSTVVGETWRRASSRNLDILPLIQNLAWPSPATGWDNAENPSFLDRAAGRFDAVLMLALLHHLMAGENLPLGHILDMAARITTGVAIVEYVSPEDVNFRRVSRGRDQLFSGLSVESFETACAARFDILDSLGLEGGTRRLYALATRTTA